MKVTWALPFERVALTPVTTSGLPAGTTAFEAGDAVGVPVDAEFDAVEVKVYEVPFVKPVKVQLVDGEKIVHVADAGATGAGDAVTTYESAGPPPVPI